MALIRRWRCEATYYSNKAKPCYIIEGRHHPISTANLQKWSRAIENQYATVNVPPPGLEFTAGLGHRGSAIQKQPQISPQLPPQLLPAIMPPPWHISYHSIPNHFGNFGLGVSAATVSSSPPPTSCRSTSPSTLTHNLPAPPPLPPPPPQTPAIPPSSPLSVHVDPDAFLVEYIRWLQTQWPTAHEALEHAMKALTEEFHDFEALKDLVEDDWKRMDIPIGLGRRIIKSRHSFKQQRKRIREETNEK